MRSTSENYIFHKITKNLEKLDVIIMKKVSLNKCLSSPENKRMEKILK